MLSRTTCFIKDNEVNCRHLIIISNSIISRFDIDRRVNLLIHSYLRFVQLSKPCADKSSPTFIVTLWVQETFDIHHKISVWQWYMLHIHLLACFVSFLESFERELKWKEERDKTRVFHHRINIVVTIVQVTHLSRLSRYYDNFIREKFIDVWFYQSMDRLPVE